jgi:hypothetical protein
MLKRAKTSPKLGFAHVKYVNELEIHLGETRPKPTYQGTSCVNAFFYLRVNFMN